MKLATLRDGSRDGQLIVVSADGTQAHLAAGIATRLGQVLDDWGFLSPQLEDLSATLSQGKARHAFPFDAARCMAVLPRPVGLTRLQADAAVPAGPGVDRLIGGRDPVPAGVRLARPGWAVITGDLRTGADRGTALEGVRLLTLALDWLVPAPTDGPLDGEWPAATVLGPIAVTPDELGPDAWAGHLRRPLRLAGSDRAAEATVGVDFGASLARSAAMRPLPAGHVLIGLADGPPVAADPGRLQLGWTAADGGSPCGTISVPGSEPA
jgi:fumarylacetoacetate (FAA) hydrolase